MSTAGLRRRTALIVESDRCRSDLAAMMMKEFDLEITQVADADDAIDHLCASPSGVDIALIEMSLDGSMDGLALARRISVLWPTMSVIVTSRTVCSGDAPALPSRTTFVRKPCRPLDIVAATANAARADHSLRSLRF
ncbi:response regulator [Enterovirga rhinocerotis]|uniref:Response regulator receiver domain-containing protein n=1 Tax=Enterovirga rhinocerotis TaxID=1339210 RepID=A0A4R7C8H8_9HYPH|nr:response regulator [Enterovirga rhinocerotis]TDR94748.1 response regulator receiver domain-containing protein [Enterovirga rhinocerotis]